MKTITRRLIIEVNDLGFIARTEWSTNGIDWRSLSETFTQAFPLAIVARVASRDDYRVFVRRQGGR
jgi:hypothetical protein